VALRDWLTHGPGCARRIEILPQPSNLAARCAQEKHVLLLIFAACFLDEALGSDFAGGTVGIGPRINAQV
jgi:hypothetical protein